MTGCLAQQRCEGIILVGIVMAMSLLAACGGSNPENVPPDARFGHRYEGDGPNNRETVIVTPPDDEQSYNYYRAFIDTVHVRPAPFDTDVSATEQKVPVEILAKGAFSNSCSALHEAEQERAGHIITVQLTTRWPKGAVCAQVERPFRFYLRLPGRYGVGSYTLKINDEAYAFRIKSSSES